MGQTPKPTLVMLRNRTKGPVTVMLKTGESVVITAKGKTEKDIPLDSLPKINPNQILVVR